MCAAENQTVSTNSSNASEEVSGSTSWDTVSKCLLGIPLAIVICMAIAGNLLVCIAIYNDRRLRKLGNLFLVSLAVADLFVSSLVMTFAVPNDVMGYWMFGPRFCDTWIAFDVMCSTASILNLCAISLDRFIHIKDPFRYSQLMTKRVVLLSIAGIWLMSALISFLPISLGLHKPKEGQSMVEETLPQSCAMDLSPTYGVVSSIISFYAPCVVMVTLYSRLYLYARKHVKNIKAVTMISRDCLARHSSGDKTNEPFIRASQEYNAHHHHSMDHKAAVTLGVIMGTFLLCWVPFFCINIIAAVCKSCISLIVFKCLTWLGYCNSALNPIIYSIFNTEFREAFHRILVTYFRSTCWQTTSRHQATEDLVSKRKKPDCSISVAYTSTLSRNQTKDEHALIKNSSAV